VIGIAGIAWLKVVGSVGVRALGVTHGLCVFVRTRLEYLRVSV